ncbi:hypothetical protein BZA70DRAFT_308802 [Myxozyma melibiosi]|uniref:Mitochondrial 15S rRNA processing factor CCM1 n=1 Tax=Myxozyma melibiosi TaxID=54550 RepID=A0ABR1FDV3_9ASCO
MADRSPGSLLVQLRSTIGFHLAKILGTSAATSSSRGLGRPFRLYHDELLLWSMESCWSSICGSDVDKRRLHNPFKFALYSARTIAFVRSAAAKYSTVFGYKNSNISADKRRLFSQSHYLNKSDDKNTKFDDIINSSLVVDSRKYWDPTNLYEPPSDLSTLSEAETKAALRRRKSLSVVPPDPQGRADALQKIVTSHNILLADHVGFLWSLCVESPETFDSMMDMRYEVYNYFRASKMKRHWNHILQLFNDTPESMRTELDYQYDLWALLRLGLVDLVPDVFMEGVKKFEYRADAFWNMIKRHCSFDDDSASLLVLWSINKYRTNPVFADIDSQTFNRELHEIIQGIAKGQQNQLLSSVGYILKNLGGVGKKICRKIVPMLAKLQAPLMSKKVYMLIRQHEMKLGDLHVIVHLLNKGGLPEDAAKMIAYYEAHTHSSEPGAKTLISLKLHTLAALKDYAKMEKFFDSLHQPSTEHYNIVMQAYGDIGDMERVNILFKEILERFKRVPYSCIYILLRCRVLEGDAEGAAHIFYNLHKFGRQPDEKTYNLMLKAYKDRHDHKKVFEIFFQMVDKRMRIDEHHITTVMSLFSERGEVLGAETLLSYFDILKARPDSSVFSSLLYAYARSRPAQEFPGLVKKIKSRMTEKGILPDARIYNRILYMYAERNNSDGVKDIIAEMNLSGVPLDSRSYSIMLRYLALLGEFKGAQILLDRMPSLGVKRDASHYTEFMLGLLKRGETKKILKLIEAMLAEGIQPTQKTITTIKEASRIAMPARRAPSENSEAESAESDAQSGPTAKPQADQNAEVQKQGKQFGKQPGKQSGKQSGKKSGERFRVRKPKPKIKPKIKRPKTPLLLKRKRGKRRPQPWKHPNLERIKRGSKKKHFFD